LPRFDYPSHLKSVRPLTPPAAYDADRQEGAVSVTERLIDGESVVFESTKIGMVPIRAWLTALLLIVGAYLLRLLLARI
jgi:hypothetical protein